MRTIRWMALILAITAASAEAQGEKGIEKLPPRIAVTYFNNASFSDKLAPLSLEVPEKLIDSLKGREGIIVIPWDRMLDAQQYLKVNPEELMTEEKARAVGREVTSDVVIYGGFVEVGGVLRTYAKLIDVQSGKILGHIDSGSEVGQRVEVLAAELARKASNILLGDPNRIYAEQDTTHPMALALLSIPLPGYEQYYNGEWGWGLFYTTAVTLGLVVSFYTHFYELKEDTTLYHYYSYGNASQRRWAERIFYDKYARRHFDILQWKTTTFDEAIRNKPPGATKRQLIRAEMSSWISRDEQTRNNFFWYGLVGGTILGFFDAYVDANFYNYNATKYKKLFEREKPSPKPKGEETGEYHESRALRLGISPNRIGVYFHTFY
ncbi:MAG: DUF5683 domain-containing protein [bacterium]